MKFYVDVKLILSVVLALAATTVSAQVQAGFPDSLRRYSDNGTVPFRIGTAVTLQGGPSQYPPNGYQPGLLTTSPRDRFYQTLVRRQFNQIEAGNETKMMSLWTGGAVRINGHYAAKTNLLDANGPLSQLCTWAGAERPRLTVRGHCMVYYQDYTLPTFPADQPPLFSRSASGKRVLSPSYTPDDLRDMLRSYVQQVVDATMAQNSAARTRYGTRVVEAWDVTNEVVSEDPKDAVLMPLGFSYRNDDPWYNNRPRSGASPSGYDYVADVFGWAAQEMAGNVGKTIAGHKISAADRFSLYYNDYNLEWSAPKMAHVLALIKHVNQQKVVMNGLGFQAHVEADGLDTKQFGADIDAAIAAGLRFSVTEADCAINQSPGPGKPLVLQQESNQSKEYAQIVALCVSHKRYCDALQIWGATDDGSWLQNAEATPITRWVKDTRPGATQGQDGYWPKESQFAPETLYDVAAGTLDSHSGRAVSSAYDQILAALKAR